MARVAFVHEGVGDFIASDIEIVSKLVRTFDLRWKSIRDLGIFTRSITRSDAVIVWFASGQAAVSSFLIAKLLHKRFIAIAGGSEVCRDKAIRGSGLRSDIAFAFTKLLLNNADYVVCVSRFTLKEVLNIARPKRFVVLHHGIDAKVFNSQTSDKDTVVTITAVANCDYMWRKGIDRFLKLASLLPHRRFVLAGRGSAKCARCQTIRQASLPNVLITGELPEVAPLLQRARFYCQLSRHEGFGVAVAEAMACKCVPIVSDSGALPEVVGRCGVIVPNGDPARSARAIEGLWDRSEKLGESARDRVIRLYSVEQRISGFKTVLRELGCL